MDKIFFTFTPQLIEPDGQVPDWIQLTPGVEFSAVDGRGPFVADVAAILAAAAGKKLAIDINHAIDRRGSVGEPSPAVGWIVELQSRVDGIWGRVEWTAAGKTALLNKEYGAISPVLVAQGDNPAIVVEIARASLCNDPGLPQLQALFNQEAITALAVMGNEKQEAVSGKATTGKQKNMAWRAESPTGKQKNQDEKQGESAMEKQLRAVLSLPVEAKDEAVLEAIQLMRDKLQEVQMAAAEKSTLEQQIGELNAKLVEVTQAQARSIAEAFVAKAIERFQIVPSLMEHFISRHMKEPELVEKEIAAQPVLMTAGLRDYQPDGKQDDLSVDERRVCQLMGVDVTKFAASKAQSKEII